MWFKFRRIFNSIIPESNITSSPPIPQTVLSVTVVMLPGSTNWLKCKLYTPFS